MRCDRAGWKPMHDSHKHLPRSFIIFVHFDVMHPAVGPDRFEVGGPLANGVFGSSLALRPVPKRRSTAALHDAPALLGAGSAKWGNEIIPFKNRFFGQRIPFIPRFDLIFPDLIP